MVGDPRVPSLSLLPGLDPLVEPVEIGCSFVGGLRTGDVGEAAILLLPGFGAGWCVVAKVGTVAV